MHFPDMPRWFLLIGLLFNLGPLLEKACLFAAEVVEILPLMECRGHDGPVTSVIFVTSQQQMVSAGEDRTIRRWQPDGREIAPAISGHAARVNSIAASLDGTKLVSGGNDATIRLWDLTTGESKAVLKQPANVIAVGFGENGSHVVAGIDNGRLETFKFDGNTYQPFWSMLFGKIVSIAAHPDGKTIWMTDGATRITGADITTRQLPLNGFVNNEPLTSFGLSFDGSIVASGQKGGYIRAWGSSPLRTIRIRRSPNADRVLCQPSSTGRAVVLGLFPAPKSTDAQPGLFIWDLTTDQIVARLIGVPTNVTSLAISSDDSRFAVATDDGRLIVWDLEPVKDHFQGNCSELIEATKKLESAANNVIQIGHDWSLVTVPPSDLPYLKDAGTFVLAGPVNSLGMSFTTQRPLPVYLLVDWSYKGPDDRRSAALREYKSMISKSGWIGLQVCPWNPQATIFFHPKTDTGEKNVPFMSAFFPNPPQIMFSPDANPISTEDRKKLSAHAQSKLMSMEISRLLGGKSWRELDEMADQLRKEKQTFPDGTSSLWVFYETICPDQSETGAIETMSKEWLTSRPKSTAAKMALAIANIRAAWAARGTNFASKVTKDGAKEMNQRLTVARKLANEIETQLADDPMVQWCLAECERGLGNQSSKVRSLAIRGLKKDPWFSPIVHSAAISLLPRWLGENSDMSAFVRQLREEFPDGEGLALGAVVVNMALRFEASTWITDLGFETDAANESLQAYVTKFPQSGWPRDLLCLIACQKEDFESAKTLFAEIGMNCTDDIWNGLPRYLEWREAVLRPSPERLVWRHWAHADGGGGLAISNDGKSVVTCGAQPMACVSDLATGKTVRSMNFLAAAVRISACANGEFALRTTDELYRWKAKESIPSSISFKNPDPGASFDLTPDGNLAVVAPKDGKTKLFAFSTDKGTQKFKIPSLDEKMHTQFPSIGFSSDSKRVILADATPNLTVIDLVAGKIVTTLKSGEGRLLAAALFDRGRKAAAVESQRLIEWDVATGKVIWSEKSNDDFGTNLTVSEDGRWWVLNVMQGGEGSPGRLMIWDRKRDNGWKQFPEIRTRTWKVAFTGKDQSLLTISESGFLRLWKLDD